MPRIELGFHRWQRCVITIIPHVLVDIMGFEVNLSLSHVGVAQFPVHPSMAIPGALLQAGEREKTLFCLTNLSCFCKSEVYRACLPAMVRSVQD